MREFPARASPARSSISRGSIRRACSIAPSSKRRSCGCSTGGLSRPHWRGPRAARRLRRLLVELAGEPPPVKNELERRFLELVRGAQLPAPVVNEAVAGHLVDFHWPQRRLVAETDGRATHAISAAFE